MPRKKRKQDAEFALPDDWDFEFDVGKPTGYNPNNKRSYVCATLINKKTGQSFQLSQRGSFTKREAHQTLEKLLMELVEQHIPGN